MKAETVIVFVFDQSGSMGVIAQAAIDNYNNFVDEQKKLPDSAHFRLILFNTVVKTQYEGDLALAPHLGGSTYKPEGNTALYDAMADAIDETGGTLAAMPAAERPKKVIIATMTDGQENSSVKFQGEPGRKQLAEKIKHQQDVYNWEFIFLGANIDAKAVAQTLNIPIDNSIQWESTEIGTQAGFAANNQRITRMRTQGVPGR